MSVSSRFPIKTALIALTAAALFAGCGKNKGQVHFENLTDGAEVESPFTVKMAAENLVVEPAAEGVKEGHGHFHILVNTPVPRSLDPIPNDGQHIHYGAGQTEAVLDLPVGEHTLILQFAKGDHRPYDPQITQEIRVRVTKQNSPAPGSGETQGSDGHDMDGMNGASSGGGLGASGSAGGANGGTGAGGRAQESGSRDDSVREATGNPRNIQPAPGAGSNPGAGGSMGSGMSGGAAM